VEAFGKYLDGTSFTVDQVRFVTLIVDELTHNGLMDPARLYESPFTDRAPTGPEAVFAEADVDGIVAILRTIKANAEPSDVVA
jgi:type I restriction enzyme R subunit